MALSLCTPHTCIREAWPRQAPTPKRLESERTNMWPHWSFEPSKQQRSFPTLASLDGLIPAAGRAAQISGPRQKARESKKQHWATLAFGTLGTNTSRQMSLHHTWSIQCISPQASEPEKDACKSQTFCCGAGADSSSGCTLTRCWRGIPRSRPTKVSDRCRLWESVQKR